jgi:hypothetical protein
VIAGGLAVSTVFTLVLLPCLLRMGAKPAFIDRSREVGAGTLTIDRAA